VFSVHTVNLESSALKRNTRATCDVLASHISINNGVHPDDSEPAGRNLSTGARVTARRIACVVYVVPGPCQCPGKPSRWEPVHGPVHGHTNPNVLSRALHVTCLPPSSRTSYTTIALDPRRSSTPSTTLLRQPLRSTSDITHIDKLIGTRRTRPHRHRAQPHRARSITHGRTPTTTPYTTTTPLHMIL
jgi:hypothetical protein